MTRAEAVTAAEDAYTAYVKWANEYYTSAVAKAYAEFTADCMAAHTARAQALADADTTYPKETAP